ncbi:MAG: leucine-rich repeat protein [Eggerthellaceae bacterium]|jgi:hypothetical protein
MTFDSLVFQDAETSLDDLLKTYTSTPISIHARDVYLADPAVAREGEVWSPQLPQYEQWSNARRVDDDTSSDLLVAGARTMGMDEDFYENMVRRAEEKGMHSAQIEGERVFRARQGGLDGKGAVIGVRPDGDSYTIAAVDISAYAAQTGQDTDLIVVLPSDIDGVPIRRIASEAFARRHAWGVGVRLLVVPDSIEVIGAEAFSVLSVRTIWLGKGVKELGSQEYDMANVRPRVASRKYLVDEGNTRYLSLDGDLLTKDSTQLLFFAPPYKARVRIPHGVNRVSSWALARGCAAPSVAECPSELDHVDSNAWPDTVWTCVIGSRVHRELVARGIRTATPQLVAYEGCWYDFDEVGAVLIAGPLGPETASSRFADSVAQRYADKVAGDKDAVRVSTGKLRNIAAATVDDEDVLALPATVEGKPLVRIAARALPYTPPVLTIPASVRVIERDNTCRGLKRLVLTPGIKFIGAYCFQSRALEGITVLPKSLEYIGAECFQYSICRLDHIGLVVNVPADPRLDFFIGENDRGMVGQVKATRLAIMLETTDEVNCRPPEGIPADLNAYDELLISGKRLLDRLGAILFRLMSDYGMTDRNRKRLVEALREFGTEALQRVALEGNRDMVAALVKSGFINDENFDEQIELLRLSNRTDCVMYLMEQRNKEKGARQSIHDKFAL